MNESHSIYYWLIVAVAVSGTLAVIFVLRGYLVREAAIVPHDFRSVKNAETKARLQIDFGNGRKRAFRGEVIEGMTVYDALLASVGDASFRVGESGIFEIDGVKNNSRRWQYYVNGEKKPLLPEFEEVGPGDEIVFKFE